MAAPKYMSQVVQHFITFLQTRATFTLQPNKQEMKSLKSILKHLYTLLCSLVSYEICQGHCGNGSLINGFELELEDMVTLSAVLFKELHKCLLTCSDNTSIDQDIELEVINVDEDSREELLLLLRCCVLMVRCNPYDEVLTDQFRGIVDFLLKLCSQGRLARKEMKPTNGSGENLSSLDFGAKSPHLYVRFLQQMLEVYLDESFADRPFRECIAISKSLSFPYQNQSSCSSLQIETLLEIIASHFLLSISGKNSLYSFSKSLIWIEKNGMLSFPELSLRVASSLINHPIMNSAPPLLMSHLISLVSEVIGIHVHDLRCGNIYLSTLCDSVGLYSKHMSKFNDFRNPGKSIQNSFESHFQSEIYHRINFMLGILGNTQKAQSTNIIMENDVFSYIKMNMKIVDEFYRDNVFSFLNLLINRVISVGIRGHQLSSIEEMTKQDHCMLASILKLMSCSLLQATQCFKKNLSSVISLMKGKNGHLFISEYNFNVPIEVREIVVDALKPHLSKCKEFELIFMHFTGLLSVCIFIGVEMIVKGCLFLMMVLLNTLALELGSLEFLKPLVVEKSELPVCGSTFGEGKKSCVRQTSSLRVASNFRRERQKLLRDPIGSGFSDEEICNGEIYLRYLISNPNTIYDYDELADYIECKPYRDYEAYVSYRYKRRYKKYQKSTRRFQLAKLQAYSSMRSGSKRKSTRKPYQSSKYLKVR